MVVLVVMVVVVLVFFLFKVIFCSPSLPGTNYIALAALKLVVIPLSLPPNTAVTVLSYNAQLWHISPAEQLVLWLFSLRC